jgi:bacteriocin-like protein
MDESTVTERLDSRLAEPLGELTKDELALVTGGFSAAKSLSELSAIGYMTS